MSYIVKEVFYTLQGEGARTGKPAVFCRFSGCNLWSGREQDRSKAICKFCDTDFVGGTRYADAFQLAETINTLWPVGEVGRFVVCTGGEPLLQIDRPLINALHHFNFEIAIETNGSIPVPHGIDWVCVSPKAGAPWVVKYGRELKIVMPQSGFDLPSLEDLDFLHFSLQPMDGPNREYNTKQIVEFCLCHPRWRLSLQTHKILGIR